MLGLRPRRYPFLLLRAYDWQLKPLHSTLPLAGERSGFRAPDIDDLAHLGSAITLHASPPGQLASLHFLLCLFVYALQHPIAGYSLHYPLSAAPTSSQAFVPGVE
jgi:hypothetical protein